MMNHANGQMTASRPTSNDALTQFRNRTPAESLGLPSGNGLVKPFLQAGVVTLVLLALLTVGPYLFTPTKNAEATAPEQTAAKQEPTDQPKNTTSPKTTPESVAKTPGKTPAGKDDILNKLGENSTKTASPKVNPLDKKDDDLLKDIK